MKSSVSIERHQCPICLVEFDTGDLLIDLRIRNSMGHHTMTGHSPCPECQGKLDDGFIALIGTTDRSTSTKGSLSMPRTGVYVFLTEEAFVKVFNVPVPEKRVCLIDPEAMAILQKMSQQEESSDADR